MYLVDPVATEPEEGPRLRPKSKLSLAAESIVRKIRGEPHPAEELFTGVMREAILFDDLLRNPPLGGDGDRSVVERLIEYERGQRPNATRLTCLQNAINRWAQENR